MITPATGKKEATYRGKTITELSNLEMREFAKYLGSRERRTILRNFQVEENFLKKCRDLASKDKPIRTHLRDIIIVPQMVNMNIFVHNGKEFAMVKIVPDMIGHRLGEFAPTRKQIKHGAPGVGATRSSAALSVK